VRRMLSQADGAYNADGFKIDFSARIPSGPGIRLHGNTWGLELMKLYLFILYDEAKKVKQDALIMSHTPHPYLADVVDMIRLNDINTGKPVNRAMTHRAKVAAAALPNAVIDTDNWPIANKATWREYVRLQPELGVPSLYYASHIDSTQEPLTEDDYALIRESWARARQLRLAKN
ncbi:MAG: family 31 glycosyl hydrolase, alpha-glucosidase, partial [Paenibacillus sp.]|nr:family 31 glycosyl hydrolase, alpha-glucosidase [Paenibacillus sp.]